MVEMARETVIKADHSRRIRCRLLSPRRNEQNRRCKREHLQGGREKRVQERRVVPGVWVPLRFGEEEEMQDAGDGGGCRVGAEAFAMRDPRENLLQPRSVSV
jgi:hypothetical protein